MSEYDEDEVMPEMPAPGTWVAIRYEERGTQRWVSLQVAGQSDGQVFFEPVPFELPEEFGGYEQYAMDTWVIRDALRDGTVIVLTEPEKITEITVDQDGLRPRDVITAIEDDDDTWSSGTRFTVSRIRESSE